MPQATDPRHLIDTVIEGFERVSGPRAYLELDTAGLGPGASRVTRLRHVDGTDVIDRRGP